MVKLEIKFPCGYEIKMSGFSLAQFVFGTITTGKADDSDICPLHGRNCPPNIHKKKRRGN